LYFFWDIKVGETFLLKKEMSDLSCMRKNDGRRNQPVSIALIHLLACCPKVLPFTFGLFCGQDHVLGLSFLAVVSQVPPYSDLPGRHAGRDMMQTSVQFLGVELDL
jgi:hypothetical protein